MTLYFGKTGTLLRHEKDGGDLILYPFHSDEKTRGGAFWCVPNFDELPEFPLRHGEYRKTEGDCRTPKTLEGSWGKVLVTTVWEEHETGVVSRITITSLSHETLVRPGFHPYFAVKDFFNIFFLNEIFSTKNLEVTKKNIVLCNDDSEGIYVKVSSRLGDSSLTFTAKSSNPLRRLTYGLCLWSDNMTNYICIEPVIGSNRDGEGLPNILKLGLGETLDITVKLSVMSEL